MLERIVGIQSKWWPRNKHIFRTLLFVLFLVYFVIQPDDVVKKFAPQRTLETGSWPRILCLIITAASRTNETQAVRLTWAKRCNKYLFIVGGAHTVVVENDTMYLPVPDGKYHLTIKVRRAFQHAYFLYKDEYDWILKADDDTYVIMENLRHMVSGIDPNTPAYLGLAMRARSRPHDRYASGAGYVISKEAFRVLVSIGFCSKQCKRDGRSEDRNIACALSIAGVPLINTLDTNGKETFHHVDLARYLFPPHEPHIYALTWHKVLKSGHDCCSTYSVCFHKVKAAQQYVLEYILYHIMVHGQENIVDGPAMFKTHVLAKKFHRSFEKNSNKNMVTNCTEKVFT